MSLEYTNRQGDVYYLQAGTTKAGKPNYYFARKLTGRPVDSVPDGYEIYENPQHGQVYVRKVRPSAVREEERTLIEEGIRKHSDLAHFIVEQGPKELVVHVPSTSRTQAERFVQHFAEWGSQRFTQGIERMLKSSPYSKELRFRLVDEESRLFCVDRWCYRGAVDDWIQISGASPLPLLIGMYLQHLGKESLFDLM